MKKVIPVCLDDEDIKFVTQVVSNRLNGFTSRSEFIRCAIRNFSLKEFQNEYKNNER